MLVLLQELHCSGGGNPDTAAIMHRPEGSLQLHASISNIYVRMYDYMHKNNHYTSGEAYISMLLR